MTPRKPIYANLASTLALVVALGSGGAYAASLAKNSVGSPQIKKGAVKASDLAKNSVTGKAVKESTLGTVPSAATVETLRRAGGTAAVGAGAPIGTVGPFTVSLQCGGTAGTPDARLALSTSVDHGRWVSNNGTDPDFNIADGPDTTTTQPATNEGRPINLMLTSASGQQFAVLGALSSNGSNCWAEVVLVG
ncbi:MAG TPA: hypothetical protein PLZ93_14120 [Nocardioides sp.]|uniref:hypothetical protein n=1 Tax=uncultured Nocardioides sp. TaxID=198441 RepID=UPI00263265DA|nr:hypothetical protein [uncultured Nocardioides sp.]HRI96748.1 hypothetical protein [Nocardioides sp.]HRK48023.1 hypothetical protein [Nocardioides sp.]